MARAAYQEEVVMISLAFSAGLPRAAQGWNDVLDIWSLP